MSNVKNVAIEQCILSESELSSRGFRKIVGISYMYMMQDGRVYSSLKNNITEPNKNGKISFYTDMANRTKDNISTVQFKIAHMNTFPEEYGSTIEYKERIFEKYLINEDGVFYSLSSGDKMSFSMPSNKSEYPKIGLRRDGKKTTLRVHQLIADIFLPKPSDFSYSDYEVNHIDGNKHNFSLTNLEWVSKSENMQHAYDTGLYDSSLHIFEVYDLKLVRQDEFRGSRKTMEYLDYGNEQILRRVALHNMKAEEEKDLKEINGFYIIYKRKSLLK